MIFSFSNWRQKGKEGRGAGSEERRGERRGEERRGERRRGEESRGTERIKGDVLFGTRRGSRKAGLRHA